MGIMVYALLWVLLDLYHKKTRSCGRSNVLGCWRNAQAARGASAATSTRLLASSEIRPVRLRVVGKWGWRFSYG